MVTKTQSHVRKSPISTADLYHCQESSMNKNLLNHHSGENHDDFHRINGIGDVVAKALYDLGICTFRDLANFSPEDLADLLKMKSKTPHIIRKEKWIEQAQKFSDESQMNHSDFSSGSSATDYQDLPSGSDATPSVAPLEPGSDNLEEVANFFVSFIRMVDEKELKTKVYHSESGKEELWEGIAMNRLIEWMLDQADILPEKVSAEPSQQTRQIEEPVLSKEIQLTINDLLVTHVREVVSEFGGIAPGLVRVENYLEITGAQAFDLTYEHAPFAEEIYLFNTETNQTELAAKFQDELSPDVLTYPIQQDFAIPPSGRYQLYVMVRLLPPMIAVAQLQGPILSVNR